MAMLVHHFDPDWDKIKYFDIDIETKTLTLAIVGMISALAKWDFW